MSQPDLKIINHPDKEANMNVQVVDFGFAKITIESIDHQLTLATAIYLLEITKNELLRVKS